MTFAESAEKLGTELPEGITDPDVPAETLCTDKLIDSLQERFDLFGNYYPLVKKANEEIHRDEAMKTWLNGAARYYQLADHDHARDLPVPLPDGSLARDFLPLMAMLPSVDAAYEIYRKRGFSHEDAVRFLGCIKLNIFIVESRILGRPAITTGYFRWLAHYLKGTIFDHGGLNFEMKKSAKNGYYLKNRSTGEIVVLSVREKLHRSGMPLGSAGFEEEEGCFSATFEETDTAYLGHPVINFRTARKKERFEKTEWDLFLSPDEDIINVHIPRKTDLSPENVTRAYKEALEITKKCYPEHQPKAFVCSSWLMDPALAEILGENSRLARFAAPYLRFPNKSAGKEVFSFVFRPMDAEDLSALPENTSLERGLKKKYLKGEYVYAFTGMLPFDKI